jgi:hypothetical protein
MRPISPTTTKAASGTVALGLMLMLCLPASARVAGTVTMLQDAGQIGGRSSAIVAVHGDHEPPAPASGPRTSSEEAPPPSDAAPAREMKTAAHDLGDDCRRGSDKRLATACTDPPLRPFAIPIDPRMQRSIERYRRAVSMLDSLRMHGPARASWMAPRRR